MQNVVARVGRAFTAAVAGGGGAQAADCRARAPNPSTTPSFLGESPSSTSTIDDDGFEVIDRGGPSSSSPPPPPAPAPAPAPGPLADQVSPDEVNEAIDIVLQHLPRAAEVAEAAANLNSTSLSPSLPPAAPSSLASSGSSSPASSHGSALEHMREAEDSLAVAAEQYQQAQAQQRSQQQRSTLLRATVAHVLSNRRVRGEIETALQSPELAQALLRIEQEGGAGGGGGENFGGAIADLYPLATRAALAAAPSSDDDGRESRTNLLDAVVAETLEALSSAKDFVAGAAVAAKVALLDVGVHILGWTRHLAQVVRGEETGAWMWEEGEGRRGRASRLFSYSSSDAEESSSLSSSSSSSSSPRRSSPRLRLPSNLDEWVKLVSQVVVLVSMVIFLRRRGVAVR